jgi:hypothetical protein
VKLHCGAPELFDAISRVEIAPSPTLKNRASAATAFGVHGEGGRAVVVAEVEVEVVAGAEAWLLALELPPAFEPPPQPAIGSAAVRTTATMMGRRSRCSHRRHSTGPRQTHRT